MKPFVFLLALLFALTASQAGSKDLYYWTDETGKIHIVDEIDMVPESHRDGAKIYWASPGPRERPPAQKRVKPESASGVPEKQEEPETAAFSTKEETGKIEALRQKKDELEEKRVRQRALLRRFRSSTVRSTVYKKGIKQLDGEIEAIQKELDTIRQKDQ